MLFCHKHGVEVTDFILCRTVGSIADAIGTGTGNCIGTGIASGITTGTGIFTVIDNGSVCGNKEYTDIF